MTGSDSNPLNRWSRRKRGLDTPADTQPSSHRDEAEVMPLQGEEVFEHPSEHPEEPQANVTAEQQAVDVPPAEGSLDHTLPAPETLGPGSDFKAYLVPGVSAALKRRALRRLYATGNYNVRDGLDDYDQDYSQMRQLSSAASEKVRQWGRKALESLEEQPQQAQADDATRDEPASPCGATPPGEDDKIEVSSPRRTAARSEKSPSNDDATT